MTSQVLGGQISRVNGQDQIVPSGNYCCSSFRMAFMDEKDYHGLYSNHMSKPHRLSRRIKGVRPAEIGALAPLLKNSATELKLRQKLLKCKRGCPRGVMVKATDCGIVVNEFVFQSCYYVQFRPNTPWERYEPTYPLSYRLNSTNTVLLGEWLWH